MWKGFRLQRIVSRGNVVLERSAGLNPVRIEGIKNLKGSKP